MRSKWISVDDGMPKNGERVLTFNGLTFHCGFHVPRNSMRADDWSYGLWDEETQAFYALEGWYESRNSPIRGVTHWMPLPAPPTIEEDER